MHLCVSVSGCLLSCTHVQDRDIVEQAPENKVDSALSPCSDSIDKCAPPKGYAPSLCLLQAFSSALNPLAPLTATAAPQLCT